MPQNLRTKMPDILGRYTLAEIREKVWRRLDAIRASVVDSATGEERPFSPIPNLEETQILRVDPVVSKEDLNMFINASITKRFVDLVMGGDETIFSDEALINVRANEVEYELPEDAASIRAVYWKWPDTSLEIVPPSERFPMREVDEENGASTDWQGVPTYRRRLNTIILNSTPTQDDTGGLLIEYIKWINPLISDNAVLETQLARLLQEVVIIDATIDATVSRLRMNADELRLEQSALEQRLTLLSRNLSMPRTVRLVTGTVLAVPRRG